MTSTGRRPGSLSWPTSSAHRARRRAGVAHHDLDLRARRPDAWEELRCWTHDLDLLLQVTGTEDFPLMEQVQANLDSAALPEVVYGRDEPPLIHFRRAVEARWTSDGRSGDGER